MKTAPVWLAVSLSVAAGCAANPKPIIDTRGVDPELLARDMAECEEYTHEIDTLEGAAKGTAAGAVVGAAAGAVTGDVGDSAALGGIYGATRSALDADRDKQRVYKNCMRGRGYRVLN